MPLREHIKKGTVFGRLTTATEAEKISGRRAFNCKCECGNSTTVKLMNLKSGHTKSCGCLRTETSRDLLTTHGGRKDNLYKVWSGMKARCNNKNHTSYERYGGRGIFVCKEWNSDYMLFREWSLLSGYKRGLQIDRINNDKEYSPDNCRWVTNQQNSFNRSGDRNTSSQYKGVAKTKSGKWSCYIDKNGVRTNLGTFKNEKDAAICYNYAASKLFGEFANLNTFTQE